jgi:DNA-binding NarL/FixJ family response regulator
VDADVREVAVVGERLLVLEVPPPRIDPALGLSEAERAVARGLVEGLSNETLAARRGVTTHTIAKQVSAILRKLGLSSRWELVARLTEPRAG